MVTANMGVTSKNLHAFFVLGNGVYNFPVHEKGGGGGIKTSFS